MFPYILGPFFGPGMAIKYASANLFGGVNQICECPFGLVSSKVTSLAILKDNKWNILY